MTTKRALIKELAQRMGMYGRCREEVSEFIHRTNNRKTFRR